MKHFEETNVTVIETNEECTYMRHDLLYIYNACYIHVNFSGPVEIEDIDVDTLFCTKHSETMFCWQLRKRVST